MSGVRAGGGREGRGWWLVARESGGGGGARREKGDAASDRAGEGKVRRESANASFSNQTNKPIHPPSLDCWINIRQECLTYVLHHVHHGHLHGMRNLRAHLRVLHGHLRARRTHHVLRHVHRGHLHDLHGHLQSHHVHGERLRAESGSEARGREWEQGKGRAREEVKAGQLFTSQQLNKTS